MKLDITRAIVENGQFVRRDIDQIIVIDGTGYAKGAIGEKEAGIYEYWYDDSDIPEGKQLSSLNYIVDPIAGKVLEARVLVDIAPEQMIANLTAAVQSHLDATARTRNYDGILSLCSYSASTNPTFATEGLAGVAWRDAVWAECYAIMAAVQAGTRTTPTEADLIAELPVIDW